MINEHQQLMSVEGAMLEAKSSEGSQICNSRPKVLGKNKKTERM
jgi:hypothetical protein